MARDDWSVHNIHKIFGFRKITANVPKFWREVLSEPNILKFPEFAICFDLTSYHVHGSELECD